MDAANLRLSTEEMRLVMDPGVILTKNSILKKVVGIFAGLSEVYREALAVAGDAVVAGAAGSPKIARGENYQGLPYVMLDYPRVFGREDVLAIRTFFWWGHGFSVTLHLKGAWRAIYLPVLQQRWAALAAAGFHVGVAADEWRHEHVAENYRPMESALDLDGGVPDPDGGVPKPDGEVSFLKLSAACGLDRWEEAHVVLSGLFRVLVSVLGDITPGD